MVEEEENKKMRFWSLVKSPWRRQGYSGNDILMSWIDQDMRVWGFVLSSVNACNWLVFFLPWSLFVTANLAGSVLKRGSPTALVCLGKRREPPEGIRSALDETSYPANPEKSVFDDGGISKVYRSCNILSGLLLSNLELRIRACSCTGREWQK